MIQVSWGAALILSGSVFSDSLNAVTVPETGEKRSLTALTLSTEPKGVLAVTAAPILGTST